jgi:peptidyl-prolyl cis-trans isomerase C
MRRSFLARSRSNPPWAVLALISLAGAGWAGLMSATHAWGAERVPLDRVKVVVGNLILTEREVASIVQLQERDLRQNFQGDELQKRLSALEKDLIERMVEDLLLESRARRLGIEVKEPEINRRLDAIAAREPTAITTYGEDELKSYIVKDLLKQQVLQREVNAFVHVDDAQIIAACREAQRDSREVHVGHILIRGEAAQAKEKLDRARRALDGGMDFLEAAERFSEDPSAAQNKGDLGFIKRGQFVKAFEDTAFGMQPGEVSAPVQTQFGLHLIKVFEQRSTAQEDCEHMAEVSRNRFADQVYGRLREKRLKEYFTKLRAEAAIRVLD